MKSKAVYFRGNKEVEIVDIEVKDPKGDEIQAKTIANGICKLEIWQYKSEFNAKNHQHSFTPDLPEYNLPGKPFIPGHEGIGIVTKVGEYVEGIKEGDLITTSKWSEYTNQKDKTFIKLHTDMANAENYIVEPVSCVVTGTAYLNIYPGDRVIVFGAGYMGLLLLQLLANYPLSDLIAVDLQSNNLELASKFGATETINLQTREGKERLEEFTGRPFDITYECSESEEALNWCTKLAKIGGKLGLFAWHHGLRSVDASEWHLKGLQVLNVTPFITTNERALRCLEGADNLMASGKICQDQLITNKYKLDDIDKAMKESTAHASGFIKSILKF